MGFFSDLKDWHNEQKRFKEAEEQLFNKPKKSMLGYVAGNFKEEVIKPTKEDYREFKQSMRNDTQKLDNEFKRMVKEISPPVGGVVEKITQVATFINNPTQIGRKVLAKELRLADHIFVRRGAYTHHALYNGNNTVIHYSDFIVQEGSLEEFSGGADIEIIDGAILYSRESVIGRAKSRLYERDYNLVSNNCEHFVRWCRSGDFELPGI